MIKLNASSVCLVRVLVLVEGGREREDLSSSLNSDPGTFKLVTRFGCCCSSSSFFFVCSGCTNPGLRGVGKGVADAGLNLGPTGSCHGNQASSRKREKSSLVAAMSLALSPGLDRPAKTPAVCALWSSLVLHDGPQWPVGPGISRRHNTRARTGPSSLSSRFRLACSCTRQHRFGLHPATPGALPLIHVERNLAPLLHLTENRIIALLRLPLLRTRPSSSSVSILRYPADTRLVFPTPRSDLYSRSCSFLAPRSFLIEPKGPEVRESGREHDRITGPFVHPSVHPSTLGYHSSVAERRFSPPVGPPVSLV